MLPRSGLEWLDTMFPTPLGVRLKEYRDQLEGTASPEDESTVVTEKAVPAFIQDKIDAKKKKEGGGTGDGEDDDEEEGTEKKSTDKKDKKAK